MLKLLIVVTVDPDELLECHKNNILGLDQDDTIYSVEGIIESEVDWMQNSGIINTEVISVEKSYDLIKSLEDAE